MEGEKISKAICLTILEEPIPSDLLLPPSTYRLSFKIVSKSRKLLLATSTGSGGGRKEKANY